MIQWCKNSIIKLSIGSLAMLVTGLFVVSASAQTLYNNGGSGTGSGLATGATSKSGVAAPTGGQYSEVQNNAGDTTSANTVSGFSCINNGTTSFRLADDFTVPPGQTWTVSGVDVYGYMTGFAGAGSPFTSANIRIYNGSPLNGGTVVYGDTTTNRLGTSVNTLIYRVFNTVAPAPGTAPGSTRAIYRNTITTSGLTLTAGTYWIDYQLNGPATGFCPGVTIVDTRGYPNFNALQFTGTAYVPLIDDGNPATAADYPQDLPFQINGTAAGTLRPGKADLNGDGKTDYTVVRNSGVSLTWYVLNNAGGINALPRGVQFGASGDRAVPADYDGDGRDDIAVFRPGVAATGTTAFYILQSATSTLKTDQFGITGDDPSVVGDYDGDGKDDVAVYRANTSGGPGFFFYRASTGPLSGQVIYNQWGQDGDIPSPGDYDGDGRFDFVVKRNVSGQAVFYLRLTTAGQSAFTFGLSTDAIVPGDYDGDGKTDIAVSRDSGGSLVWYYRSSAAPATVTGISFGATGDIRTQGNYDGDGKTDFAVFRSSTGSFYYLSSQNNIVTTQIWGASGDTPAPSYNNH